MFAIARFRVLWHAVMSGEYTVLSLREKCSSVSVNGGSIIGDVSGEPKPSRCGA